MFLKSAAKIYIITFFFIAHNFFIFADVFIINNSNEKRQADL